MIEKRESRESMKFEAIKRMHELGIAAVAIDDFNKSDKLLCSDYGIMSEVPEEIKQRIKDWESKYNNLVYHVIHSHVYGQEFYDCLSVSCYEDDWLYEYKRLLDGWPMSHSFNLSIPDFTESGTIFVKEYNGTLMRMG